MRVRGECAFQLDGRTVNVGVEHVARLSALLSELADEGRPGADAARARLDAVLHGAAFKHPLEWTAEGKDALAGAVYRWMNRDGVNVPGGIPEVVAFELRYALLGEWEDELGPGMYLFELERAGAILEVLHQAEAVLVPGEPVTLEGESWIVANIGKPPDPQYRARVHAQWDPGDSRLTAE